MSDNESGQVQAIEALVRAAGILRADESSTPCVVVPQGYTIQDLEKLQERPSRVRAVVSLTNVDDFLAYGKEWADKSSIIFADESKRTLAGVIDYHEDQESPSWGDHKFSYAALKSRELIAWEAFNGKALNQEQLAEFLEERIEDVAEPSGASLLESALKLQIIKKAVFGSTIRLSNGTVQFNYSDDEEKGTVALPETFALGIPLFHRGQGYKVKARLRYRLNNGSISFTYKLLELESLLEHAFGEIVAKVRENLPAVKLYGGSKVGG